MLGSEQRHGLPQSLERWSFSDSYDLRREVESPPEPEPAPSFILPMNATQNGDYDHIGNYSSTRACSELGFRDLSADRRLHSSCSGLYMDPYMLLQDSNNKALRLNTNPLFLWRNRKRSRVARAVSFDPTQKRTVDKEVCLPSTLLKFYCLFN
ncbi:hypothetical protein Ciccas_005018 [Cichlidogyrus casuarinus]|uniref:Uncharacterized protein n=1 Tax=Cichlidogyrus casuarinus TaxID=1844966 RepID=A0ABD2QA97_9PLAT